MMFNKGVLKMTEATVGRPKKPAKRRNYKITFDLLARLSAIARLEDRSDTAQLERWIREGSERWLVDNPGKGDEFNKLVSEIQAELEGEDD
jgi:hypothetical protein